MLVELSSAGGVKTPAGQIEIPQKALYFCSAERRLNTSTILRAAVAGQPVTGEVKSKDPGVSFLLFSFLSLMVMSKSPIAS